MKFSRGREDRANVKFKGRAEAREGRGAWPTSKPPSINSWSEPASPPNSGLWRPFLCGADFQSAARFSAPFEYDQDGQREAGGAGAAEVDGVVVLRDLEVQLGHKVGYEAGEPVTGETGVKPRQCRTTSDAGSSPQIGTSSLFFPVFLKEQSSQRMSLSDGRVAGATERDGGAGRGVPRTEKARSTAEGARRSGAT